MATPSPATVDAAINALKAATTRFGQNADAVADWDNEREYSRADRAADEVIAAYDRLKRIMHNFDEVTTIDEDSRGVLKKAGWRDYSHYENKYAEAQNAVISAREEFSSYAYENQWARIDPDFGF